MTCLLPTEQKEMHLELQKLGIVGLSWNFFYYLFFFLILPHLKDMKQVYSFAKLPI